MLASWCARLGRLQRLRTVKLAARPPVLRTKWRRLRNFSDNRCQCFRARRKSLCSKCPP